MACLIVRDLGNLYSDANEMSVGTNVWATNRRD